MRKKNLLAVVEFMWGFKEVWLLCDQEFFYYSLDIQFVNKFLNVYYCIETTEMQLNPYTVVHYSHMSSLAKNSYNMYVNVNSKDLICIDIKKQA